MTSRDFCYWLQGYFEISEPTTLSPEQLQIVKNHLNMVFVHEIDPSFGGEKIQEILNQLHNVGDVQFPYHTDPQLTGDAPSFPSYNTNPLMKC